MLRWFLCGLWLAFALVEGVCGQLLGQSPAPQPGGSSWELGVPILQSWVAKDYRSHHEVVSAVQTKEGSVCFASMASVLEFDGVRWTKYPVPGAWVKQVALGGDGHVYVAADGEFGRLERTLDGSRTYRSFTDLVPTNQRPFGVVRTIAVRPEGVYFSSQTAVFRWSDAGLALWPIEGGKPTYLHSDGPDLWLSNPATGLQRFDGRNWPVVTDAPEFKANPRATLVRLNDGRHLFGLFQGGIVQWDGTRVSPWPTSIDATLRTVRIMDLMRLPDGRIAVATGLNGLYLLDESGRYLDRLDQSRGLNNDTVFDLALDRSGGLWMSTRNGVARWDPSLPITRFDKRLGLPEASVLGLVRHRDTLHVVLTGVGIFRLARDTNRVGGGHFEALPADVGAVHRSVSHPSGLIIGSERGVFLWDGTQAAPVAKPQGNAKQTWVWKRNARFVFVGTESAILVYAVDGRTWREVRQWPMPGEVLRLGEDTDGAIWAGISSTGFVQIPPPVDGADWASCTPLTVDATRGLSGRDSFFQTEESPLGICLLSDYAGYRFDKATSRAVIEDRFSIDGEKGLYFGIQSTTRDGEMWGGVTRVGSQDIYTLPWPFGRFRLGEGGRPEWRSAPASWNAIIGPQGPFATLAEGTSTNGVLWVAGESSLLRIALSSSSAATPAPEFQVELTGPRVGSKTLPLEGMHSLAYTRDPIVFGFKAPRLDLGAEVRYQTRLVGFNEAWSAPTDSGEARFSGLSGGPYTFEVRAMDADGRLSGTNRCVFEVAAPPYRSGRALAGYALLVLMGFQGFVKWRVERVDRKRRELESLVAVRTRELAEARDAAEEASRAKSRFLANMSHELRTPLNGVLGFSQLLSQEQELSNRNRDRIRLIQSCGDHLLGLINDVLDLSKVEAGRVELRLAPMDLRELLRDLDATFASRAAQRGLRLHVASHWAGTPRVLGDAQRLRQVLENLLGNALKFTREGSIRLEVIDLGDGRCRFAVVDTGAGMSLEDCARLFQPFSQAVSGRPAEPGAGLGLAISQHLVGLMGGRIEVESEPGKGSRFEFTIPFQPVAEAPVATTDTVSGARQYRGARRRVLVVDDVEVNRRLLREMLGSLGFVVDDVATGEAALDRFAIPEVCPDLVILDLRMPGMDGFELTRRLRALPQGGGLKIIATSASVFSFTRDEAVKLGCDDFLPKPFQQQELERMLALCLGLEWETTPAVKPSEPVSVTTTEVAVSDLEQLLEAANRGDVGAIRMQLSSLRESGVGPASILNELDALASQFQMAALRERISTLLRLRASA